MRYARILEQVHARPWLITPQGWASVAMLLESKLAGIDLPNSVPQQFLNEREEEDEIASLGPRLLRFASVNGVGVGVVQVHGVLGKGLSAIEKSCGACGYEDVVEAIEVANADPTVSVIMLDVDSPGGAASGVGEPAMAVAESGKPVLAYANGQMASAAYYLSAGATMIAAERSSMVGSIGTLIPWVDKSKAYAAAGYKVDLIKAGALKGTGWPGTSLSEEQRNYLQGLVDSLNAQFTSHVKRYRRVADGAMEGQEHTAEQAGTAGLVDKIVIGGKQALQLAASLAR